EVVDHRFALPEREGARLGDLVASGPDVAVAVSAQCVATADARPEVVEDVAVEGEAFARGEPDLPDPRALVLQQEPGADARVRGMRVELVSELGRPVRETVFA